MCIRDSPSIDVNFSDAISGNKQISMLGLKGPYILISQENIPVLRVKRKIRTSGSRVRWKRTSGR